MKIVQIFEVSLLLFLCKLILIINADVETEFDYCYKDISTYQNVGVGWKCLSNKCIRSILNKISNSSDCFTSLNVCKLLCDNFGSLWPKPTGLINIERKLVPVNLGKIAFNNNVSILSINSKKVYNMIEYLHHYFVDTINASLKNIKPFEMGAVLMINLKIKNANIISLTYSTPENYTISISTQNSNVTEVTIEGENYFGLRHGIETLSQLVVYDDITNTVVIPKQASISDQPVYKHRGILLDTARSYYSVESIKRTLDAMAYNKLNTFHWHITDSHSFPFVSKHYPEMSLYGAYTPSQVYTWEDIRNIVKHANIRGIRVIPELDAPAHVGEGWRHFENFDSKTGGNDSVLLCFNKEPWKNYCAEPPCGILNPVNPKTYDILKNLYAEFKQLFDTDVFHMGGDEVLYTCWNETDTVKKFMKTNKLDLKEESFLAVWSLFQSKALSVFDSLKTQPKEKIILWTSKLTASKNVKTFLDSSRYIIQVWTTGSDKQIADLLNSNYELIISNYDALYFDCGFGAWIGEGNNWCSPYIGWQKVYTNDLEKQAIDLNVDQSKLAQILGSEAALWSEQSDTHTLDNRLWPRAAAMAERLWSNPKTDWKAAELRFLTQRERMSLRGISTDVIEPLWCHQNEGDCNPT